MNSRKQFLALETMSRERAQIAKKEFEYWLAEPKLMNGHGTKIPLIH